MSEEGLRMEDEIKQWHRKLRAKFKRLRKQKTGCQWGVADLVGPGIDVQWQGKSTDFPGLNDGQIAVLGYRDAARCGSEGFNTWQSVEIMALISNYRDLAGVPPVHPTTIAELRYSLGSLWRIDAEARRTKPSLDQCKRPKGGGRSIFGTRIESFEEMLRYDLHVSRGSVRVAERRLVSLLQAARDLGFREAITDRWPDQTEEERLKVHEARDSSYTGAIDGEGAPKDTRNAAPALKNFLHGMIDDLKRKHGDWPSAQYVEAGIRVLCGLEEKRPPELRACWIEIRSARGKERESVCHHSDNGSAVTFRTLRNWREAYLKTQRLRR